MHWQDIGSPMVDPIHISLPFMKMHGLGNDFVVIDARSAKMALSPQLICALADRHRGVGFDQLAVMKTGDVDAHLDFFNADVKLGRLRQCHPLRGPLYHAGNRKKRTGVKHGPWTADRTRCW